MLTAVVAVGLLGTGCSAAGEGGTASPATGAADRTSIAAPSPAEPAEVALAPADGALDLPPTTPVEISVTAGELEEVTVVDDDGAEVPGAVEPAAAGSPAVWVPEQPLEYAAGYTVTAVASGADGAVTEAESRFGTVDPDVRTTPAIGPLDGTTVGVGMPIRVFFDEPVTEKADVERRLTVTSSEPTDGIWSWFGHSEVHFRPSDYWPAGIDVTLDAELYGVELADGVWGAKDRSISFSIGDRHVSVVDVAAHTMRVHDGDRLVRTFPVSAGSDRSPSRNGPHVVSDFRREMIMDSSSYGVPVDSPDGYRTEVEFAVRINDNGEFVHAAPWSVAQQGRENVSHGCINLSTERAAWFYGFSQAGDVVEIENSPGPTLSAADGAIYDWTIPWDEWQAGSALA